MAIQKTTQEKKSCAQSCYEIDPSNLPLSCPMPDMTLWNAHPKIYLPIEALGEVRCPYCSTVYILKR